MAAIAPFVKLDDGTEGFASNCFPVRGILNGGEDGGGAWLVSHRAEQRRRFKAVLCAKPRTYSRIKEERKKADRQGTTLAAQSFADDVSEPDEETPLLDGFYLMKHCCVEDPVDLCSVNIAGKELTEYKEEDFQLFDNVAYVNAAENYLPFEAFRGFPILRELEVPLNAIRGIKLSPGDYPTLEMVDVSYNNLSHDDILTLGTMPNLKVLHLTGNHFRSLPPDLAVPYIDHESKRQVPRFRNLEILMLDDNKLSDVRVFASLAGLKSLKHLNMEKNEIFYVPQLKSVEGTMIVNDDEKAKQKLRRSARKSARGSAKTPRPKVRETEGSKAGLKTEDSNPPLLAPANTILTQEEKSKLSDKDKGKTTEEASHEHDPDFLNIEFTGTLGDLSAKIKDLELNMETPQLSDRTKAESSKMDFVREEHLLSSQPPFPELRYINLAYNFIEEEEALLALAAWPLLMELIIHNNPLTTQHSGDPPLLTRFLQNRLGINIIRKKKDDHPSAKPKVEVPQKKSRKVTSIVPKIPKLPIEERLMLEAPKPPSVPKPGSPGDLVDALDLQKPLVPPISENVGIPPVAEYHRPFSAGAEPKQETEESVPRTRSEAWKDSAQAEDPQGSAFFMTQVEEQEAENETSKPPEKKEKKHKKRSKDKSKVDQKYRGYEILLDYEEDPDMMIPTDMQGSIRALKYSLNHERVYRDPAVRLDKLQKPVEPYRKKQMLESLPGKTKQQMTDEALANLKSRTAVEEANLQDILSGQGKSKSQVEEAQKLLSEIQRRYNTVRVNSMKEAREVKNLIQGIKEPIKKKQKSYMAA